MKYEKPKKDNRNNNEHKYWEARPKLSHRANAGAKKTNSIESKGIHGIRWHVTTRKHGILFGMRDELRRDSPWRRRIRFLIWVQTREKTIHTHSTAKNICFTLIRTLDKIASFLVCISFAKLRTVFFSFFICCYYTGNNYHAHCTELCSWNRTNAALNRFSSFLTLNNEQGFR